MNARTNLMAAGWPCRNYSTRQGYYDCPGVAHTHAHCTACHGTYLGYLALCPMHAAAPAMLESLKALVAAAEYWFPRWGDPEGANSRIMQAARLLITQAAGETA